MFEFEKIQSEKLKNKVIESTHQLPHENLLLLDLPGEEWKPFPVAPFDECYVVSNKGRIKRLARSYHKKNGMLVHLSERIVKQTIHSRYNYYLKQTFYISVFRAILNGLKKTYPTGRIVYCTFVKPFDLSNLNLMVRYKDGNGCNLALDNLYLFERKNLSRWIQDNDRRSRLVGASDRKRWPKEEIERWLHLMRKKVSQYDFKGQLIATYDSRLEAAKTVKISPTQITAVLKDKQQTAGGFLWKEGSENPQQIEVPELRLHSSPVKSQKVAKYTLEGDLISVFPSIKAAAKDANISSSVLSDRIYTPSLPKGYIWKAVDELEEAPAKIVVVPFIPIKVQQSEKKSILDSYTHPYQNYSLDDMPDEIWKTIPHTGDTHFASNYGRIKAADRIIERGNAQLWQMGRIVHQSVKMYKKNYIRNLVVHFEIQKKMFSYQVPNLIYTLFHGEIPKKYTIRFIDDDPLNCRVENLTLRTLSSKYKQYYEQGRLFGSRFYKPIAQYTQEGEYITTFPSLKDAAKETGLNKSKISECATGKRKTHMGFIWKYIQSEKETKYKIK